ncbi:hypothetical protein BJG94_16345 [Rhizobium sp. Td3]|nr:hypothetical protein BJG94_16345 [Rhizobium sp. Td3]
MISPGFRIQPRVPETAGADNATTAFICKIMVVEINSFKSVFPANLKDGSSIHFPLNSSDRVRGKPASV